MEIETRILTSTHFPEVLGNFYAMFPFLTRSWNKHVKYVCSFRALCCIVCIIIFIGTFNSEKYCSVNACLFCINNKLTQSLTVLNCREWNAN